MTPTKRQMYKEDSPPGRRSPSTRKKQRPPTIPLKKYIINKKQFITIRDPQLSRDDDLKLFLGKVFHNNVNTVAWFKRARDALRENNK